MSEREKERERERERARQIMVSRVKSKLVNKKAGILHTSMTSVRFDGYTNIYI